MSALSGWIGASADESERFAPQRTASAVKAGSSPASVLLHQNAGLCVVEMSAPTRLVERSGIWIALSGHPQWRSSSTAPSSLHELAADVIDRICFSEPDKLLQDLSGDFSLVLIDPRAGRGILAVDGFGVRNIVYVGHKGRLLFASDLDSLRNLSSVDLRVDSQAIYDYVFFHVVPGPQTVFSDVHRVPPGCCVEFRVDVGPRVRKYWSLQFSETAVVDLDELKSDFLAALRNATSAAAHDSVSGAFLSGGTDSSTISGMLGRVTGVPAQTFSIGFAVSGYDEMHYARIAATHFGTNHHEYYVTPSDVTSAVGTIANAYDQPFGNASAIPTFFCAKLAREHGIERILAGDGGDELFGGNERYAKHKLLSYYQRLPGLLRRAMEPVLLGSAWTETMPVVRKLRSYVEQARHSMPRRYESYNLLEHLGAANVFEPDFLATVDIDHPHALMQEAHAPYAGDSLINQMLGIDLRFVLADGDLPKVTRACELADVDVAFPMLAAPVVDVSARLPSSMKLRGARLRWFFKEALKEFLPPETISKKKHGFGLPVGAWLVSHPPMFRLAQESLNSLRPHGIIQSRFIDELTSTRLSQHPAYFGTMVWVLMMLGLWFDSRRA